MQMQAGTGTICSLGGMVVPLVVCGLCCDVNVFDYLIRRLEGKSNNANREKRLSHHVLHHHTMMNAFHQHHIHHHHITTLLLSAYHPLTHTPNND